MPTDEARRVSGGGQPIIDGWIIPEDLSLTFANGKQQPVDVIVGFNKDDLVLSTAANTRGRDVMAWHMRLFAEKQTQIGKKAYFYTFTHEGPLEPGAPRQGAAHASEIAYVFQTLDKPRIIPDRTSPKLASESAKDIAMADQISSYWVNFATNGNPNGKGLPEWPVFKDRNAPPHVIGEIKEYPSADVLNAFDAEYAKQMAALTAPAK
jgi:para-nitrobenzyl esterase